MKQYFSVSYRFKGQNYGTVVSSTNRTAARRQFRRQNPQVRINGLQGWPTDAKRFGKVAA